jgi:CHAD domain-containing protein
MQFSINNKKPFLDECLRISGEQFQIIKEGLTVSPEHTDEGIHSARKAIKKLRALLHSLRVASDRGVIDRHDAALKALARQLSGARDSAVMLQTLSTLNQEFAPYIKVATVKTLEKNLRKQYQLEISRRDEPGMSQMLVKELAGIQSDITDFISRSEGLDHQVLISALENIYRAGRRGWKKARAGGKPKDFHNWRRKVKNLWYLARLIKDWNPGRFGRLVQQLDDLGEVLGFDHDMFVLQLFIQEHPLLCGSSKQAEMISALIHIRQQLLRQDALVLANPVYSRKPGEFISWVNQSINTRGW